MFSLHHTLILGAVGKISFKVFKSSEKLVSLHPYLTFTLYNLTNVDNLVNFLHPSYNGFSASLSNFSNSFESFEYSSCGISTISLTLPTSLSSYIWVSYLEDSPHQDDLGSSSPCQNQIL